MSSSTIPSFASSSSFSSEAVLASDTHLHDCPEVFVRQTLRQLAPRMMAGCNWARSHLTAEDDLSRPKKRRRSNSPSPSLSHSSGSTSFPAELSTADGAIPPTHIFSLPLLRASPSSSRLGVVQDGRLLAPIHALPFSLTSPHFATVLQQDSASTDVSLPPLSLSPAKSRCRTPPTPPLSPQLADETPLPLLDDAVFRLPIIPLDLSASPAFAVLYDWVYYSDTTALCHSLLGLLSSSSSLTATTSFPATPALPAEEAVADMDDEELEACLDRVQSLRELVVELQVEDRDLWETMQRVWDAVADELEGVEGDEE